MSENTEVQVKRGPGRPPVKKNTDQVSVSVLSAPAIARKLAEDEAWVMLYSAILSTYTSAGPAICKAAASNADAALAEYKSRFAK